MDASVQESVRTAVITGAGKAKTVAFGIAQAFAQAGYNLVLTGHSKSKLEAARELEGEFGVGVCTVRTNVEPGASAAGGARGKGALEVIEAKAETVVQAALEAFGRIDVLINCEQAAKSGVTLDGLALADFDMALCTGFYPAVALMRACYPYLRESRGSVINLVSLAALGAEGGQAAYAASKEGLHAVSRVAAADWASDGITVNCIAPLVQTGAYEQWAREFPDAAAELLTSIPMGRLASAQDEVGATCVYLASAAARSLTGQTICLDGGRGLAGR